MFRTMKEIPTEFTQELPVLTKIFDKMINKFKVEVSEKPAVVINKAVLDST